jgi:hypothetical protein
MLVKSVKKWTLAEQHGTLTEDDIRNRQVHDAGRKETKEQRRLDEAITSASEDVIMLSFDLENVFALPRTSASSAYYKRKLNVYNMTMIDYKSKQPYCVIWDESQTGRAGNDMACAVAVLLNQVMLKKSFCSPYHPMVRFLRVAEQEQYNVIHVANFPARKSLSFKYNSSLL